MEQAALAWFARCQQGLSDDQEREFQSWLCADPRHAELFNELDGTWTLLGRVNQSTASAAPVSAPATRRRPGLRFALAVTAAAAALAVTYVSWWSPAHYRGEAVTEIGAQRKFRLPDGSVVSLNTDSAVATVFTPTERRIRLERGEAHFAVARSPDRPFIVEVAGVSVRAVGTAFNVRLDAQAVEVLVTEGRVRVDDAVSGQSLLTAPTDLHGAVLPGLGQPVLISGQKVIVALMEVANKAEKPPPAAVVPVSTEEIQRELAWQERRLEFDLAPLGEIVAEFNRYNRHKLVIGDPALAQHLYGGSFNSDDQAGFVRMLRENYGVVVEETETATVLRAKR
jgi:transmembrane sensor